MKVKTESQEQQTLVMKLRWFHPEIEFFAIPNGGKRGKAEARSLVLEGTEAGTPDLFIAEPREFEGNWFAGLFVEMKRDKKAKSKLSDVQKVKHARLEDRGYKVVVCYGALDAYKEILLYLEINTSEYMLGVDKYH